MTPTEFAARVTAHSAVAAAVVALAALGMAGLPGGVGVLAGGALAVGGFRWVAARALAAVAARNAASGWLAGAGLRYVAFMAVSAALLAAGWAHPVALVVGLTVVPSVVVVQGLRCVREER